MITEHSTIQLFMFKRLKENVEAEVWWLWLWKGACRVKVEARHTVIKSGTLRVNIEGKYVAVAWAGGIKSFR